MFCVYVRSSASFSIERCRYPITMSASRIFSPSSVRRRRNTPCVLGCWGPMLTTKGSEWIVNRLAPTAERAAGLAGKPLKARHQAAGQVQVVLAQRPPGEPFPQEEPPHVGMAFEEDAQ